MKYHDIYIIGVQKRKERGIELEDIIAKTFPNLGKETDIQVQDTLRDPNKINHKRCAPIYIVIKMAKIKGSKEKNLNVCKKTVIRHQLTLQQKLFITEKNVTIYLK